MTGRYNPADLIQPNDFCQPLREQKRQMIWKMPSGWPDVEMKRSPIFPKVAQKVADEDYLKRSIFQNNPPKITQNLGYFCNKIYSQDLSKMFQSDHTEYCKLVLTPKSWNGMASVFSVFGLRILEMFDQIWWTRAKEFEKEWELSTLSWTFLHLVRLFTRPDASVA